MSDREKDEVESVLGSQTTICQKQASLSLERLPKPPGLQSGTFKFYLGSRENPEVRRASVADIELPGEKISQETITCKTDTWTRTPEEDREGSFDEFSVEKLRCMSDESRERMEHRRQQNEGKRQGLGGRSGSDLERKKLEAELKASEEIAKIKQSIIEKRLELELASLRDNEPQQKMGSSVKTSQGDLRAIEEMAMRKQAMIENNLAEELNAIEYQTRLLAPRAPPPVPTRNMALDMPKNQGFKQEFLPRTSSNSRNILDRQVVNSMGIRLPELRNLTNMGMLSQQDEPRYQRQQQQPVEPRYIANPNYVPQGQPGSSYNRNSVWKSMMSKVKKKLRSSKDRDSWN